MKTINKLIIALFLALSFNAMASSVDSIILKDNSVLSNTIEAVHYNFDGSVDYIELVDGSKVEGFEVQIINRSSKFDSRLQTRAAVRTGGDGSGG